ncbi:SAM-dependent methyltransferase [Kineosporia corallincola]|uniref:SAM-dependent methyltransferase n=1 Tax=Kineosporia corallincola TaxID=2835133 RepID=UPI003558DA5F
MPNSARMYDYWLGGKDNYAADRQLADLFLQKIPSMREMARANRDFVNRAARVLAADGVRQFLDIGTGIPTSPNLHETAQAVAPDAHVVYADNDPVVLAHARALMVSNEVGQVAYIAADLRRPERILSDPQLREQLDLDRPVALMLIAVLMLIDDQDDVQGAVAQLREALPSGSYLALTHPTADFDPPVVGEVTASARATGMTFVPRTKAEVAGFFGDWELTEPGIVPVRAWRPDGEVTDPESAWYWAGVARKP